MKIVSIDQSTTSTSAFLFDTDGGARKIYASAHQQIHPRTGWVEHDPLEILSHVAACLRAGRDAGAEAVALTNQGESCLAWDAETGAPISPIIVWQDMRTKERCDTLATQHSDIVARIARLPVDPYFSASKLGWIIAHIPQAASLAASGRLRLGTTDAFFRDRLTGRFETDVATASRTSLMNIETGLWDANLCEIFSVPRECLPEITDCSGDLGSANGMPLKAAIVDQQAALYGHGIRVPGQTKFTFGTGAFVQTLVGSECPPLAHGVSPTVAWREAGQETYFALDGGVQTAAAAVNWAGKLGLFENYDQLSGFSGHALERGLSFVPALAGLACPHWANDAKGTWLGLSLDTTKSDMMQALLEGVAYRAHQVFCAMQCIHPLSGAILADGGMTQNPWFCQLLANVLARRVKVAQMPDITAFGAAQMGANCSGAVLTGITSHAEFAPDPDFTPNYERFAQACEIAKLWPMHTADLLDR